MFTNLLNPDHGRRFAAAALVLLMLPLAAADNKSKKAPAPDTTAKRLSFDPDKIVWPNPPAIARIKFQALYTGEKFDPAEVQQKVKKPKQSWMDRVAGAKPPEESNLKLPIQYLRVYGLAVDSQGLMYAADQGVDGIFITNQESKQVEFIRNGHEASFGMINGLAIDDNNRLFVSDSKLHKIFVFNAKHELETTFGAGDLIDPCGMAIDKENRFLYVVDTQRDQVMVFDADNYKLLRTIGAAGKKHKSTEPGEFSLPTHVAVDEEGNVYVTDTLNDRVEIFDADGNFLSQFGKVGDGPGHFERPKGIALDSDGHIWVVDAAQQRVKVFTREGKLLIYFGAPGGFPGQFGGAYGITIDKNNRVYVSEQFPGRVQVFQYVSDEEAAKEQKRREAGDKQPPATKAAAPGKTQSSVAPLRRDQSWLPLDHEAKSDFGLRLESSQLDQMFHRPKEAI